MPAAVRSSFDIAFWFMDRAMTENVALPNVKMQRLLFLAQAYFAASTNGDRLMPSLFVVGAQGPEDPNLARVLEAGQVPVETEAPRQSVRKFLAGIWTAFGKRTVEQLDQLVMGCEPYRIAAERGPGTEIAQTAMATHFASDRRATRVISRAAAVKGGDQVTAEDPVTIPKFHRGKPVEKWLPGMKKPQRRARAGN